MHSTLNTFGPDMSCQSAFVTPDKFNVIASYDDHDLPQHVDALSRLPELHAALRYLHQLSACRTEFNDYYAAITTRLRQQTRTANDMRDLMEEVLLPVVEQGSSSISIEGLDQISPQIPTIFISNHRDIVLDPLLLNLALKQHDMNTAYCAIGENLLRAPFTEHLAKLNRCFTIIRDHRSPKQMLRNLKLQSEYIDHLFQHRSNIWIAQKEGRAKDNRDETNPALLKMLALCRDKSRPASEFLNARNIVAVSFSYEYDPCDLVKAQQLESSGTILPAETRAKQDLEAVQLGLQGKKGRMSIRFSAPLQFDSEMDFQQMARAIDMEIHRRYTLFPINYAALDLLAGNTSETTQADPKIAAATAALEARVAHCNKAIRNRVLQAYANPLIAARKAGSF